MLETGPREGSEIARRALFSPKELSTSIELDGRLLFLNTDWRDILQCVDIMHDETIDRKVKVISLLQIFVDNYEDIADGQHAINALYEFVNCGVKPPDTKGLPKEMDWDIDFDAIISDMNKASGKEIRAQPYMHWFTFMSWYHAIGEGNLTYRVGIRKKIHKHEKLTPDEADWVRRNPDKIFRQSDDDDF